MAKRRTKKDKERAKRTYKVSLDSGSGLLRFEPDVNRQLKTAPSEASKLNSNSKYSDITAEDASIGTIRKDIKKSLLLSALIITIEMVLYFLWK